MLREMHRPLSVNNSDKRSPYTKGQGTTQRRRTECEISKAHNNSVHRRASRDGKLSFKSRKKKMFQIHSEVSFYS